MYKMELVWYGEDTKALDRQYNSTITTEKNCKKKNGSLPLVYVMKRS